MFILVKGPIRKSNLTVTHGDDAYFAQSLADQSIEFALISVDEIAGITQMKDGGLWISPVNRDPAHIKPEEYYLEPEEARKLIAAISSKGLIVNWSVD